MGTKIKFASAHNVFKTAIDGEENLARNDSAKLRVNPHTQLLIDKLLLRNPAWEFWASDYPVGDSTSGYAHSRFDIMSDGERLGWVGTDRQWRTGESKYEFDCDRLKQKRQKSTTPHTKDLNKAVKTILANMYNQTPAERMSQAVSRTRQEVGLLGYRFERDYAVSRDMLVSFMVDFVEARWEEFCAVPMPKPHDAARATLLDKKREHIGASTISNPNNAGHGTVLIDAGTSYIVSNRSSTDVVCMMRLDEMSTKLKSSLGILKLLDPKTHAPGIGMRVDETTYYVVDADE